METSARDYVARLSSSVRISGRIASLVVYASSAPRMGPRNSLRMVRFICVVRRTRADGGNHRRVETHAVSDDDLADVGVRRVLRNSEVDETDEIARDRVEGLHYSGGREIRSSGSDDAPSSDGRLSPPN